MIHWGSFLCGAAVTLGLMVNALLLWHWALKHKRDHYDDLDRMFK